MFSDHLTYKKRVLNNVMSHQIITPTWCCGFTVMLLTFILFSSLSYLFYYEADSLNDFDVRYDD